MGADIASLLLGFATNPGVAHLLCAYVTRTGIKCDGIRSHSPGQIVFDVELPPPRPGESSKPAVYTLDFDPTSGLPLKAQLTPEGE